MKTNSIIQTGLCAYGMSGRVFHAPFLDCMPQFNLSAIVERHQKEAARYYPEVHSLSSMDDLFGDDSLELIVVNTPNVTHYDYVKKELSAGKHVVVEKPFTATYEQAQELTDLAGKQDRLLIVFQNRRWDSDFRAVKKVIDEKWLGTLIEAEFHYDRYKLELSKKPHKEKPEKGAGLIYDLGPHLIDQAIVLFGKPEAVFAIVQSHRPGSKVDDYFEIKLLYNRFTCTLKSSLLARDPVPAYVLHGSKGSFQKSRSDIQEAELQKGAEPCVPDWGKEPVAEAGWLHTEVDGKIIQKRISSPVGCYRKFYTLLYACLRGDGSAPVPLKDSLLNMQIIEAAAESEQKKQVIYI